MIKHIHESNLIEGYDNPAWDIISLGAWEILAKASRLNEKVICEIQCIITSPQVDLRAKWRGEFRDINVSVGGRECPGPLFLHDLMSNYVLDMAEYPDRDPKEMHIRFERIHPFADGNGRTGRMLMWWHEIKLGREPTLIENDKKKEYYKWFRNGD